MPKENRAVEAPPSSEKDILTKGLENRPDLRLKKAVVDLSDSRLKLSWMQFLPSLNLSWQLGHQFTDPGDMTSSDKTRWTAYLVLSVPLYNQTRYADLDKSRAEIAKAKIEVEDAEKNAGLEIRTAKRNYEGAMEKVASASTQAELAREILEITESEYTQGTGSSLEVTDARRTRNEAEINLATKRLESQLALLDLFRAAGDDMGEL
jgi:outer membrane protein